MKLMSLILGLVLITSGLTVQLARKITEYGKGYQYHCHPTERDNNVKINRELESIYDKSTVRSHYIPMDLSHKKRFRRFMCRAGFDPFVVKENSSTIEKLHHSFRKLMYVSPYVFGIFKYGVSNCTYEQQQPFVWFHFRDESHRELIIYDYTRNVIIFYGNLQNMATINRLLTNIYLHVKSLKWRDPATVKILVDLYCIERVLVVMLPYLREYNVNYYVQTILNGIRTYVTPEDRIRVTLSEVARDITESFMPGLYDRIQLELNLLGSKGVPFSIDSISPRINIENEMHAETEAEDYADVTIAPAPLVTDTDNSEDFDRFEIHEFDDPITKNYHCTVKDPHKNESVVPNPDMIKYLDSNGILSIRPKKNYYQIRDVRRKLCQFGFNPFEPDNKAGSIHKRFKNTLRLMLYNTPGMFPGLRVIRNDLDRKRKREPQIWFRFEATNGTLVAEFDYDNYFVTVSGDLARVQAYSKLLVALKMHKRLNNFNEPVSYKVNLDLGIMEAILTSFGIWMMREKAVSTLMVNALNGIRTEIGDKGETRLEFEETLKEAADQVDPLLYSYIWLLSMAEKYDIVKIRERSLNSQGKPRNSSYDNVARLRRDHAIDVILKTH